jgi:hypothetical protein
MFLGSDEGGQVNATFTSLLASCRMVGVEPWAYLGSWAQARNKVR